MATTVTLNPSASTIPGYVPTFIPTASTVGVVDGPQNDTFQSPLNAISGGGSLFTSFHYATSIPQIVFSGTPASPVGEYLFFGDGYTGQPVNYSGFNWPQNFTAAGGAPPSGVIASTTGTTITIQGAIPTTFPTTGMVVVSTAGTTHVFGYSSYTGSVFTLNNSGNELVYGMGYSGSAISASTLTAGNTLSQYYLPCILSGTPTTTLPVTTSPITNGFPTTGYVMVIRTPSAIAASNMYVYSYTGITGSSFTGLTPLSIGPTGSNLPITSLAAGDQVVPFYNPIGAYVTALSVAIRMGQRATVGPNQLAVTISSSEGLFPSTTAVVTIPLMASGSDPGSTASFNTAPVQLDTPFAATPANMATIQVTVGPWYPSLVFDYINGFNAEQRVAALQVNATVITSPPNVTLSVENVGVTAGVGTVQSVSPTVSWLYADPDGLTQASYRVVVFNDTDAVGIAPILNINNPTPGDGSAYVPVPIPGWPGSFFAPWSRSVSPEVFSVLDTGDVSSNASSAVLIPSTSATLPDACLNIPLVAGRSYRVFVFVTAVGENGLYQTLINSGTVTGTLPGSGALNSGIDITPIVEPVLMPSLSFPSTPGSPSNSFDAPAGFVGPIATRARLNLLNEADADFLVAGTVTPSVGGWAYDAAHSTGTGTTPTVNATAPATNKAFSSACLTVSPFGTTTTQVAVKSGMATCIPGQLVTATVKINDLQAFGAHPTKGSLYFVFTAADGTTTIATVLSTAGATVTNTTQTNMPGMVWAQCKVPTGAAFVQLGIIMAAALTTGSASTNWLIFQPTVALNVLNVIDDAGLNSGAANTQAIGSATYLTQALNSGMTIENTAATGPILGIVPIGTFLNPAFNSAAAVAGVSNPNANFVIGVSLSAATTTVASVHTYYMVGSFASDASPWLIGADVQILGIPGASSESNFNLGSIAADKTSAFQQGLNFSIPDPGVRISGTLTPGGTVVGSFGVEFPVLASSYQPIILSNFSLERIWTFTDGAFSSFAAGTTVPLSTALGVYSGQTATNPGQWWQRIDSGNNIGATASVVTGGQAGNCVEVQLANPSGTMGIEQYFTVAGLTSITPTWFWKYAVPGAFGTLSAFIEFFDNAGTVLSIGNTAGTVTTQAALTLIPLSNTSQTQSTFVQVTPGAIVVPATAAFAHIVFRLDSTAMANAGASFFVDTVTMGLTGTLASSTPWLDGGWSEGGLAQTTTTTLQRSPDGTNWTTLRIPPGAAAATIPTGSGLELDYDDCEYPAGTFGVPQTFQYRVFNDSGSPLAPIVSPFNGATLLEANSFSPTNWVLIDPLSVADNIVLQVVGKVDFKTDENQTVLMPMGRGRKVVLGDSLVFGDTITLPLQTLNNADFNALQVQLEKTRPLVLRSPDGEMWYVRTTGRSRSRKWQGAYTRPLRTFNLTFETVDAIP